MRATSDETGAGALLLERGAPIPAPAGAEDALVEGDLELRLARTAAEIDAAQALRYRVFFEEMGASPDAAARAARRDRDAYDAVCDHLLVADRRLGGEVVGTYRLIRREAAALAGGFYSESEFDISRLTAHGGPILELGRSCVDAEYRGRATLQLLWRGIAAYVWQHGIELMFGCASLPGTDADAIAAPLSYLRAHHSAPPELLVRARPERRIEMDRVPAAALDAKSAFSALPPLVKGYLRVGAHVGDGAALDAEFGTIDVCVVLPTDRVTKRYLRHYERAAPPLDGGPDTRLD